ncbi:hypothetical protein N474_22620 [Pseudoalteromonas luteoviolacea CPMOR-2]|uniref:Uncharacterized protein n=1 Tax=Pseudoalteromonas luteoviolacea DSM 6061 TaxID=1365250 RepID=A0A166VXL0_9GAMM|nr:hypothetical protein N475_19390 [Pseudoalteromonas luteoviolacea DSM 6061]KZN52767.1 hypothetical protein N474_22620 [Pseudoalteromonas luteoviolacea CPMOR-2]MBE0389717.1 hypothetical protein [Pseudoalteromonas luteoviolacea DSM 6061]
MRIEQDLCSFIAKAGILISSLAKTQFNHIQLFSIEFSRCNQLTLFKAT